MIVSRVYLPASAARPSGEQTHKEMDDDYSSPALIKQQHNLALTTWAVTSQTIGTHKQCGAKNMNETKTQAK